MHAAIGGQVDGFAATASAGVVGQLTQGSLTCLAIAAPQRYAPLPNCPRLAELGYPGIEGSSRVGFWVPKGTPANVVAALNKAINAITPIQERSKISSGTGTCLPFRSKPRPNLSGVRSRPGGNASKRRALRSSRQMHRHDDRRMRDGDFGQDQDADRQRMGRRLSVHARDHRSRRAQHQPQGQHARVRRPAPCLLGAFQEEGARESRRPTSASS